MPGPSPPTELTKWIHKHLVAGKHDEEPSQECLEIERQSYQTVFEPLRFQVETLESVPWTNEAAWRFILVDYVKHVAWCDNGFHKLPQMVADPSKDEPQRFVVHLRLRDETPSFEWIPLGGGLMVKGKKRDGDR